MVILSAVDQENAANILEVGVDLARTYDDKHIVLHVLSERRYRERVENREDYYRDVAREDAKSTARRLAQESVDPPAEVTPMGRVGEPVEEILDVADEYDARFIVTGGRKQTPVGKVVFGSTVQSILLNANRPVVTVMG